MKAVRVPQLVSDRNTFAVKGWPSRALPLRAKLDLGRSEHVGQWKGRKVTFPTARELFILRVPQGNHTSILIV